MIGNFFWVFGAGKFAYGGVPDGLVIPAHILSYQSAVMSVFVSSFTDMPFIIDPMTYLLQHPTGDLVNDGGVLRKSISKM